MPDYKRKKVSNKRVNNKAKISKSKNEVNTSFDIDMSNSSNKSKNHDSIKVVKGKKLEKQRKFKFVLAIFLIILAAYLVLVFTLPVSVHENISNLFAAVGAGDYPLEIYGTDVLDTHSKGTYYYVLTNTNLSAFSNSGKEIYTHSHGFEKAVLKTSETRALIFSQGGTTVRIYNLSEQIGEYKAEKPIINADIARNGNYAVATYSDSYATEVSVFDKNSELLFKCNSAKDTVNALTLSADGKFLVIATFNADDGDLNSKINVYDIKSNSNAPTVSFEIKDNVVYKLSSLKKGFTVATADSVLYFDWKTFSNKVFGTEFQLDMFRSSKDGAVAVYNLESNKNDNIVTAFSSSGEKLSSFKFNGIISDIRFVNGHIYCMSEAKIYLYDKEGTLLSTEECDFDAVKIAVTGSQSVVVISDSKINKINFKG